MQDDCVNFDFFKVSAWRKKYREICPAKKKKQSAGNDFAVRSIYSYCHRFSVLIAMKICDRNINTTCFLSTFLSTFLFFTSRKMSKTQYLSYYLLCSSLRHSTIQIALTLFSKHVPLSEWWWVILQLKKKIVKWSLLFFKILFFMKKQPSNPVLPYSSLELLNIDIFMKGYCFWICPTHLECFGKFRRSFDWLFLSI